MVSTSLPAAGLPAGNGVGLPVGLWREPHSTEWGGCPGEGDSGQPCSSPHHNPNSLKLPSAKPHLDSLHGLRGSCVQNRLVYCVPN